MFHSLADNREQSEISPKASEFLFETALVYIFFAFNETEAKETKNPWHKSNSYSNK